MRYKPLRFCTCRRERNEKPVQGDLALTPSQMFNMMQEGIPITAQEQNKNNFYDGDTNPSFELPLDQQRGVDIADCWNASVSIRKKARKGLINDKKLYGDGMEHN